MINNFIKAGCIFLLLGFMHNANAVLINLTVEGDISSLGTDISSTFSRGDRIAYQVVYDTNATNSFDSVSLGRYEALSFSVNIGSYKAASSGWSIVVIDGFSGAYDIFRVQALASDGLSGPSVGGLELNRIAFQLWDEQLLWLNNSALPTDFLTASNYENAGFSVNFDNGNRLEGTIDKISVEVFTVPEPATLLMFVIGVLSLIGRKWRRC